MSFVDRALTRASAPKVGRVLAVVLTSPFWLTGAVVGVLVVAAVLVGRVTAQGFDDVRGRWL